MVNLTQPFSVSQHADRKALGLIGNLVSQQLFVDGAKAYVCWSAPQQTTNDLRSVIRARLYRIRLSLATGLTSTMEEVAVSTPLAEEPSVASL